MKASPPYTCTSTVIFELVVCDRRFVENNTISSAHTVQTRTHRLCHSADNLPWSESFIEYCGLYVAKCGAFQISYRKTYHPEKMKIREDNVDAEDREK